MRTGPKPLSMHLSLASIKALQQSAGRSTEVYEDAQLKAFIAGVKKYQLHGFKVTPPERNIIWKCGTVTVQSYAQKEVSAAPVLLVPSLINGSSILDLMPENSFLRWLGEEGFNAHLLDWGNVTEDKAQNSVESFIAGRLAPAIIHIAQETGRKVHVLGYCLGGTLLAGAVKEAGNHIASLTFLAAPWDFHGGDGLLASRVKFWAEKSPLPQAGAVPSDWAHTVLASLHPDIIIEKFIRFGEITDGTEEEKLFVAVEDWLNDGVDLPAQFTHECVQHFFVENRTKEGNWRVRAQDIKIPSFVIASKTDKLVDYASSVSLKESIPGAKLVTPSCGHIGMMAGQKAKQEVWQKFITFAAAQD